MVYSCLVGVKNLPSEWYNLPTVVVTQTVANEGLRVRPVTVVVEDSVRVRQDSSVEPGVTDETETATHCMVVSSVNDRVPF